MPRTLFLLALGLAVFAVSPRHHAPPVLPGRTLTPGVLNPDVRQDNIAQTICVQGWTHTIRPPTEYTSNLKLKQIAERGLPGGPGDYQEDHLISLELGGHPT